MSNDSYRMAFTTGGLFHPESVRLAALYLDLGDWSAVRAQVIADNLLQARTLSTLQRVCREVISRLRTLGLGELGCLVAGNPQEQAALLWLAVCRRYRFIAEFASEVLRERYISLQPDVTPEDFDAFFNRKAEWHLELDGLTPATRAKLRQVLFRILREADLLADNHRINPVLLSQRLLAAIPRDRRQDLLYFPVSVADLKEMTQ